MKQEIERIARRTVAMQRSQGYLTLRRYGDLSLTQNSHIDIFAYQVSRLFHAF